MRFLKNKIALSRASQTQKPPRFFAQRRVNNPLQANLSMKRKRVPGQYITSEASRQTKNIVKNYGKAICKFSLSENALPYRDTFLQKEQVTFEDFRKFVEENKGSIDGLQHFRSLLLPGKKDDNAKAACKRIFRDVGVVFIKYFSVNWIFHSKIQHKDTHLKYRFKMLRRIKNPKLFTYLKSSKGSKKAKSG